MNKLKIPIILFALITLALLGGWGWLRFYQIQDDALKIDELKKQIAELETKISQERKNGREKTSPSSEPDEMLPLLVSTVFAEAPARKETITYDGILQPSRTTYIFPKRPGEVKGVLVNEGHRVKQGDLLLEMDTREIDKNFEQAQAGVEAARAQLEMAKEGLREEEINQIREAVTQAETQLELAQSSYERIKTLHEDGIVSQQEFEQARAEKNLAQSNLVNAKINLDLTKSGARDLEIQAARAQLRQAEIQLELAEMARENTRINAPRDGVIISRDVEPGELVGEAQPPLVLGNLDPLHLQISVGERDIGKLKPGQIAEIFLRAVPDTKITGEVIRVSPVADPENRLFRVTIEIANPEDNIRPGMYAEATVLIDPGPGYPVVPREAVHFQNGNPYVYTISGGEASPRPVELGEEENGKIPITSGLQHGEEVILQVDGEIVPGRDVEVQERVSQ